MLKKLAQVEARFLEVEAELQDPDVARNRERFAKLGREHAEMVEVVRSYRSRRELAEQLEQVEALCSDSDPQIREMAAEEARELEKRIAELDDELKGLLVPKDPLDARNALLEVRAGTGGEEAALFAGDLLRMYTRYVENHGWKMETMSLSASGMHGIKEAVVLISGPRVYGRLRYEGGVHRVQRVPATEAQGRIHTSAVTVAVMPEAEELDVKIEEKDLRVDVFRSSGPGGQSVNTTDSAVRLTHVPTGLVVSCQDEKSQHKNKSKAMKILLSRLFDLEQAKRHAQEAAQRKSMVGSGDRSERIRTYNFPQGRITDHRVGVTQYSLDRFLDGEIDEIVDALVAHARAEALETGDGRP